MTMSVSTRVLKWNVPVDDTDHEIGNGRVVGVACQGAPDVVQVWTVEPIGGGEGTRKVRVYGTGQEIPPDWVHIGMTQAPGGLVWHALAWVPF